MLIKICYILQQALILYIWLFFLPLQEFSLKHKFIIILKIWNTSFLTKICQMPLWMNCEKLIRIIHSKNFISYYRCQHILTNRIKIVLFSCIHKPTQFRSDYAKSFLRSLTIFLCKIIFSSWFANPYTKLLSCSISYISHANLLTLKTITKVLFIASTHCILLQGYAFQHIPIKVRNKLFSQCFNM